MTKSPQNVRFLFAFERLICDTLKLYMAKRGLLIVISGPSGVGKGTVRELLMDDKKLDLVYSVSYTTREMRPGEKDGVDYHFVDDATFKKMVAEGGFLEHTNFVSHNYGTPKKEVFEALEAGHNVILEIEVNGAHQIMKKCDKENLLTIFILPPDRDTLLARLVGRDTEDPEVIKARLEKATRELAMAKDYDYQIVNDDLSKAVDTIRSIISSRLG